MFLFSVVYYVIMIVLSAYFNVWEDEIYSLNTTSGSLSYAYRQSFDFEVQPPFWFLLLTIWRTISDSILWARLFSMFLIIISQILLYHFIKRISDKKLASLVSVLFILNPWIIFVILEIRLFALVILLSIIITASFYQTYYPGNITPVKRVLFILTAIAALFTQYFMGFLLFANAIVLLFRRNRKPLIIYIIDMVIPLILVLLIIPQILTGIDVQTTVLQSEVIDFKNYFVGTTREFVRRIFDYLLPFSFNVSAFWYWTFRFSVIILLLSSFNYGRIRKRVPELTPFIIISIVIILFFYILGYFFSDLYSANKYTLVLLIPLLLSLTILFRMVKPELLNYWLILFSLIYITEDFNRYKKLYKIRDFPSLASYIEKNENPGESIFIYRNIGAENLEIYYKGVNDIYPLPQAFDFRGKFVPEQWEISRSDIERLRQQFDQQQSFYVIISNMVNLKGFIESRALLLDFLESNYNLIEKADIKGDILVYKYAGKTGD